MKLKKMHLPFILITIILSSSIVQFDAFADDTNSFVKGGTTIELSAEELESKNRIENDIATVKSDKQNNPEKYVNYSSRNNSQIEPLATFDDVYEDESNDSFSLADRVYCLDKMHGTIDEEHDVDYYKIKFPSYGVVEITLSSIPTDCDYDIFVYNTSKDRIASSTNLDNDSENIYIHVEPDEWYYIIVTSASGYDDSDEYYLKIYDVEDYRANLYAAVMNDIDTTADLDVGEEYFGDVMGYVVDSYTNPRRADLWDLEGAAIVVMSGHGNSDSVIFRDKDLTSTYMCGLRSGHDETVNGYKCIGTKDTDFSAARLVILAACNTADSVLTRSVAENVVHDGDAMSSLGFSESIDNRDITYWLEAYYDFLSEGYTVGEALDAVNSEYKDEWDSTVYSGEIFGNEDTVVKLPTITRDIPSKKAIDYTLINEDIVVDKTARDFMQLENYLSNNIDEFNTNSFLLDEDTLYDNNSDNYFIFYNYTVNGFVTPYYVMAFCEDGTFTKFYTNFTENILSSITPNSYLDVSEISSDTIQTAKNAAIDDIRNDLNTDFTVKEQLVTAKVDKNCNEYLRISTKIEYELEGRKYELSKRYDSYL